MTKAREPLRHPTGGYVVCGAKSRSDSKTSARRKGDPCMQAAGKGTDHHGIGPCSRHGGNSNPMRRNAAYVIADMKARKTLARFGHPIEISPAQALLSMVHEAAGNVAFLGARIDEMVEADEEANQPQELEPGVLGEVQSFLSAPKGGTWDARTTKNRPGAAALFGPVVGVTADGTQFQQQEDQRAILRLYGEWTDRLVKYSKAAIDAGVARAQVELARKQAEMIVLLVKTVLGKLELDGAKLQLAQSLFAEEMRKLSRQNVVEGTAREIPQIGPLVKSRAMDTGMRR